MSSFQPRQFPMSGTGSGGGQFGDTTLTKIFVGGLAWETQWETMKCYFDQFGEILEAVVITDKHSGRSKGYGFVTFKEPDAARRACEDPSPVIDGRRANCNLASLGAVKRTRPPTPQQGYGRYRSMQGLSTPSYLNSSNYLHQSSQYPWYSGYSQENMYPVSFYNAYTGSQFSPYYAVGGPSYYQSFYPYYAQYPQTSQTPQKSSSGMPYFVQHPYNQQNLDSTATIVGSNAGTNTNAGILSLPVTAPSTSGIHISSANSAASSSSIAGPGPSIEQSNPGVLDGRKG